MRKNQNQLFGQPKIYRRASGSKHIKMKAALFPSEFLLEKVGRRFREMARVGGGAQASSEMERLRDPGPAVPARSAGSPYQPMSVQGWPRPCERSCSGYHGAGSQSSWNPSSPCAPWGLGLPAGGEEGPFSCSLGSGEGMGSPTCISLHLAAFQRQQLTAWILTVARLFTFATTPGPLDLLYLLHSPSSHHFPSCHMGHFLLNPDFSLNLNHHFFSLTSSLHHPWHLLLPSLNSYNIFYLHPVIQYIISKIALNPSVSNR